VGLGGSTGRARSPTPKRARPTPEGSSSGHRIPIFFLPQTQMPMIMVVIMGIIAIVIVVTPAVMTIHQSDTSAPKGSSATSCSIYSRDLGGKAARIFSRVSIRRLEPFRKLLIFASVSPAPLAISAPVSLWRCRVSRKASENFMAIGGSVRVTPPIFRPSGPRFSHPPII
jgi:hypothetical protein